MMSQFAERTKVSSEKSRQEIERTLTRYGASSFMYGWQETNAVVAFDMNNRRLKFILPLPDRKSREITHTKRNDQLRSPSAIESAYEQAVRQKWRALFLVIKAKLESVASGITVFDDEFMAQIVLPDNTTVSQFMRPQIEKSYSTGEMPPLLGHDG